jgi:UDP-N-acetylmuramoyl-tripeptide--D-alanyl-D-alanine ligase
MAMPPPRHGAGAAHMSSAPCWRLSELHEALGLGPPAVDVALTGVHFDSRRIRPGDLFVALPAGVGGRPEAGDGHDWVTAAAAAGAAAALVMRPVTADLPQVVVPDSFAALQTLGAAARTRLDAPVVAITGSAGKTTLKNLLAHVLDCPAAEGSFNNDLGVPLTLARTPASANALVLEIGMNAPGEIAPLSRLGRPDVAVLTNVLRAHRGAFDSFESHRAEKLSIAAGLEPGRPFIVPVELAEAATQAYPQAGIRRFGDGGAVALEAAEAAALRLRVDGEPLRVPWMLSGAHRRTLVLAAVAVLAAVGRLGAKELERFGRFTLPPGRGAVHRRGAVAVIDDAYNANPDSMAAALDELAAHPAQRRIAVLGEMLELGDQEQAWHAELAGRCAGMDRVLLVGERMAALRDALRADGHEPRWFADVDALPAAEFAAELQAGDTVLVKGSNAVFWKHGWVTALLEALDSRQPGPP